MAKKRLIFTLLFDNGGFMLSRNFRLQRAGNIHWLKSNYNFKRIAFSIDELIILDVTRGTRNPENFCNHIKLIGQECFIPIAAGGGIMDHRQAQEVLGSGADKLVVNTALFRKPTFVRELVSIYGAQCIIASIDVKYNENRPEVYIENGTTLLEVPFDKYLKSLMDLGVGEIYLNSMDKDGTGQGYKFELLDQTGNRTNIPVIKAGGAGNWQHLHEGLLHDGVDAVATANLFNFIGQGFPNARKQLLDNGIDLARWDNTVDDLKNCIGSIQEFRDKGAS